MKIDSKKDEFDKNLKVIIDTTTQSIATVDAWKFCDISKIRITVAIGPPIVGATTAPRPQIANRGTNSFPSEKAPVKIVPTSAPKETPIKSAGENTPPNKPSDIEIGVSTIFATKIATKIAISS